MKLLSAEEPTFPDCPEEEEDHSKMLQGKYLTITSRVSPVKLYCCYGVITVLTVAVVTLSVVAFSVENKEVICDTCPRNWISFGKKCYYFSEDIRNWTDSQTSCMALKAELTLHESPEELAFLKRYAGASDHWIGLHRESPEHAWKETGSAECSSLRAIRGTEEGAYLNNEGIRGARINTEKKWICSKP